MRVKRIALPDVLHYHVAHAGALHAHGRRDAHTMLVQAICKAAHTQGPISDEGLCKSFL